MTPSYVYDCTISHVVDGDTVDAHIDLGFGIFTKRRIRLSGIDAPESRTLNIDEKKYGIEAKTWLSSLLKNERTCTIKTELDSVGKVVRVLGAIYVEQFDTSVNEEMIRLGYATRYEGKKKESWEIRKSLLESARHR
ncbi:MAG: thermonuclease family protein [Ghiorsea sp.]